MIEGWLSKVDDLFIGNGEASTGGVAVSNLYVPPISLCVSVKFSALFIAFWLCQTSGAEVVGAFRNS